MNRLRAAQCRSANRDARQFEHPSRRRERREAIGRADRPATDPGVDLGVLPIGPLPATAVGIDADMSPFGPAKEADRELLARRAGGFEHAFGGLPAMLGRLVDALSVDGDRRARPRAARG